MAIRDSIDGRADNIDIHNGPGAVDILHGGADSAFAMDEGMGRAGVHENGGGRQ